MTVSAYVPDLMDRSKVQAAYADAAFARTAAALRDAELVLVDLGRSDVLDAIAGLQGRVVGFASHVDTDLLERAQQAGVEALPRSVFFRRLTDRSL